MVSWLKRALPPSGGILYHYLALRFSRSLWRPFLNTVAQWLGSWNPQADELIIFGSSAGYSLPSEFLHRFRRVICVEPDPLARFLFQKRFRGLAIEFAPERALLAPLTDLPTGSSAKRAVERLQEFLARYPDAAVLFANVLGQLPLEFPHLSDEIFASHLIAIRAAVKGRTWASYHDILSTWAHPTNLQPFALPAGPFDPEEFAKLNLQPPATKDIRLEVTDHQTSALSAGEPMQCTWWQIAPGRYHLIGFLHH